MTLQNFFNKYNCRYLDYDGAFGNQCVDVMRAYVKEVYGLNPYLTILPRGNAKNIFNILSLLKASISLFFFMTLKSSISTRS